MSWLTLLGVALGAAACRAARLPCCAVAAVNDIASANAPALANTIRIVAMIPSRQCPLVGKRGQRAARCQGLSKHGDRLRSSNLRDDLLRQASDVAAMVAKIMLEPI